MLLPSPAWPSPSPSSCVYPIDNLAGQCPQFPSRHAPSPSSCACQWVLWSGLIGFALRPGTCQLVPWPSWAGPHSFLLSYGSQGVSAWPSLAHLQTQLSGSPVKAAAQHVLAGLACVLAGAVAPSEMAGPNLGTYQQVLQPHSTQLCLLLIAALADGCSSLDQLSSLPAQALM